MNPRFVGNALTGPVATLTVDRMSLLSGPRTPTGDGFGAVLGDAMAARGMTLTSLRRRLADRGHLVSTGTLSYWRSGQRQPEKPASIEAVREIEDLLGLDSGTLLARIGPSRRPGPPPPQVEDGGSAPRGVGVPEALRELDLTDVGRELYGAAVQVTLDVDADRQLAAQTQRTLLRATVNGAQRWFHVVFAGEPQPEPLVLEESHGVVVDGPYLREEVGLFLWPLRLPRPLAVGETALIETRVRLSRLPQPDTCYDHHLDRRTPDTVIWARFHPDARPARCVQVVQELDGPAHETPIDLAGQHTAHLAARSFGPGRLGLTWGW